jgi:hypothetical protein
MGTARPEFDMRRLLDGDDLVAQAEPSFYMWKPL